MAVLGSVDGDKLIERGHAVLAEAEGRGVEDRRGARADGQMAEG